jgi:hypothetical protein
MRCMGVVAVDAAGVVLVLLLVLLLLLLFPAAGCWSHRQPGSAYCTSDIGNFAVLGMYRSNRSAGLVCLSLRRARSPVCVPIAV